MPDGSDAGVAQVLAWPHLTAARTSTVFWLEQVLLFLLLLGVTWAGGVLWDRHVDARLGRLVEVVLDAVAWLLRPAVRLKGRFTARLQG